MSNDSCEMRRFEWNSSVWLWQRPWCFGTVEMFNDIGYQFHLDVYAAFISSPGRLATGTYMPILGPFRIRIAAALERREPHAIAERRAIPLFPALPT